MSKVRFISDLHLGHENRAGTGIVTQSGDLRGGVKTIEEHDQWIVDQWNSVVSKHDVVILLGDICFDKKKLPLFKKMKGSKHLLLGNHDKFSSNQYLQYFDKIIGFQKYKGMAWLSHAPIHVQSLRGKFNIHGHVHQNIVKDHRYVSVCVEAVSGKPISWDDLLLVMEERKCLMNSNQSNNQNQLSQMTESNTIGVSTADIEETTDENDTED